jgi:hypothetical protein
VQFDGLWIDSNEYDAGVTGEVKMENDTDPKSVQKRGKSFQIYFFSIS